MGGADVERVELDVHPDVLLQPARLREAVERAVRRGGVRDIRVVRRSIDARRGRVVVRVVADVYFGDAPEPEAHTPLALPTLTGEPAVVIVGAGPAGLFCAWRLATHGVRALLLDRGQPVRQRRRDVALLSRAGTLNEESNYCFGEGGAGTFSDGKLYTRANKRGRVREVLEAFVAYGASPDIVVDARPHIGTNRLPTVIAALTAHLQSAGQQVRFGARVVDLEHGAGRVRGVRLHDGGLVQAQRVVLASGHSAADVYALLGRAGVSLQAKPFAMGVRVEHAQGFIDRQQYGALAGHPALPAATYRVVEQACGLGVYSFCMCPGGYVAPASTVQGQQVVNGWSPSSRRGRFANSGLVVEIGPEQIAQAGLDPADPLSGLALQRTLEQRAYEAGGGGFVAPGQRLSDLLAARASTSLPPCSYPRGAVPARVDELLGALYAPVREALVNIERKMPGFAGDEAIALGVESRTSAPLRVERDATSLQSPSLHGLYPAAEGAGYAGGIMSAALDGIRIADTIARER